MNRVAISYGEEAENIPGFLLWQVSKLWQRHLNLALKDLGIQGTQAVILGNLVRLTHLKPTVTQRMLSDATKVDPMTTSQALRALEAKRLLVRQTATHDKRAQYVIPTQKGTDLADEVLQRFVAAHQQFFRSLEPELGVLAAQLKTLIAHNEITANEETR